MRFSRPSLALAAAAAAAPLGHAATSSSPGHFVMDVYAFQQHAEGKLASVTDAILETYASSTSSHGRVGAGLPWSAASSAAMRGGKSRGQASVRPSFARHLQSLAKEQQPDNVFLNPQDDDADDADEAGRAMLPLTLVTGTTHAHVDHRRAGTGPAVDASERVAFVMLNSNPDAHFEVEDTCIPIVENTLVAFEGGRVPHRTVVESGEVRLLGPFHAETMEPVGDDCDSFDCFVDYVGDGHCRDANNRLYDHIILSNALWLSDYLDGPHEACSFACNLASFVDVFENGGAIDGKEPINRGFEIGLTDAEEFLCSCLFDNGSLSEDFPVDFGPFDFEDMYQQYDGTGLVRMVDIALDEEDNIYDWHCFKPAMDSFYEFEGFGACVDGDGNNYDALVSEDNAFGFVVHFEEAGMYALPSLANACAETCHQTQTPTRGFEVSFAMGPGLGCNCLYEDGDIGEKIFFEEHEGLFDDVFVDHEGSGPVRGSTILDSDSDNGVIRLCYKSKMDNAYTIVGEGICEDPNRNRFDYVEFPLYEQYPHPHSCAARCLPSTFEFMAPGNSPGYSALTENFRGFMFENPEVPVRRLQGSSEGHETSRRLPGHGGAHCFCLYDDGTLDDFEIPEPRRRLNQRDQDKDRRLEYFEYYDDMLVETGFNGTDMIMFATPVENDEDHFSTANMFSCYKYLDKYEIAIRGAISLSEDICGFDQDEREAFISAAKDALKSELLSKNDITADLDVEIERFCDQATSVRKLQQTTWQMDYTVVVSNILCGTAGCASSTDTNGINAMISSISDTLQTNIQGGDFLTQLTLNAALQAALPDGFLECLVAWGTVYATSASQVTQTQGTISVTTPATSSFYPDWTGGTDTCLDDGQEPLYMQKNPSTWLYDSLEGCCERYYGGWNKPACLGTAGSGLWYVDYLELKCVTDCDAGVSGSTCGGLASPNLEEAGQLYADPLECCKSQLGWIYEEFCVRDSLGNSCYAGSRKFYRDPENQNVCVRDCEKSASDPQCGGLVEDASTRTYEDASSCCDAEYSWIDSDLCTARSELTPLDKFWPDQINGKCINDTDTQATDLSVSIFDTAEACCEEKMNWVALDKCIAEATGLPLSELGSDEYYVKSGKCVKNCDSGNGGDCGGLAENWDHLNDSKSICCSTFLWWIDTDDCLA